MPGSVGWKTTLFNSLYGQLQMAAMGAVFLGFALGTSATLWLNHRNLLLENKVEIERSSDAIKDVLARSLSARGQWHSDGGLGIQEELLRHTNWKQTFWIQLPDGMIMAPKASSSQIPFAVVLKAIQSSQGCQNSDHKVFSVEGRSYLTHSDRTIGPPGEQECSRLWVAEDITANVQVYRNYIRSMVMIWAVCLLATLIVVSLLVRRIVYPLVRLNILAKSVNAANLDANRLVLANAPLEVESLVDSYNQLLDRLSLSWRNQSEFVGAVSHELRNPLILISGYLRRTLRQAEGLSDTHRKGLLTAESEAKRIGRLLNDLLELAKSDSGRLSLILNPVDLEPLLIEVAELARESFLRAIDFVVLPGSGSTGKPINANADSDRLKQVVLNLIENSDKYSPRDSPITITLQQLAGAVLIRVCDQGVGVPKEDIPFIFQRFYRASNVSSDSGSGLGLSVVKLLVDAMGGEVSVENDVVQGTCFRIRLESDGGY